MLVLSTPETLDALHILIWGIKLMFFFLLCRRMLPFSTSQIQHRHIYLILKFVLARLRAGLVGCKHQLCCITLSALKYFFLELPSMLSFATTNRRNHYREYNTSKCSGSNVNPFIFERKMWSFGCHWFRFLLFWESPQVTVCRVSVVQTGFPVPDWRAR
jgi:hypothetical protein